MSRCSGVTNWLILLNLLLCKIVDDLKGACTCTARVRAIVREVVWIATVVARRIQSCPVFTWDQSCVVFRSSFLLSKGASHALFVMESSSNPAISIG